MSQKTVDRCWIDGCGDLGPACRTCGVGVCHAHGISGGTCACGITERDLVTLRQEAGAAGDTERVAECEEALRLGPDSAAWRDCERQIVETRVRAAEAE